MAGWSELPAKLNKSERAELLTQRKKVLQIKQERDIIAKATAWFADTWPDLLVPGLDTATGVIARPVRASQAT